MAADITLLKSFVDGQGAGASTYTVYAEDMDANFSTLESTINQLNAEISAFAGQNSQLVVDLITSSSPPVGIGFVGADSFVATFPSATQFQVTGGVAFASTGRIQAGVTSLFSGSGASGLRWFALAADGTVSQETAATQAILDLWRVNWNGATWDTGTLTRLPSGGDILVDGDDFQNQRIQENVGGGDAGIPGFTYDQIADRLTDFNRIIIGRTDSADPNQAALGNIVIAGTEANPGIILGDGAGTNDDTTGFYRENADVISYSVEGVSAFRVGRTTVAEPQFRLRAGTLLTEPPFSFIGDLDTGFGWVALGEWRVICDDVEVVRFIEEGAGVPKVGLQDGDATDPSLVFEADRNTGLFTPAADNLAFSTGGTEAMRLNANQQRTSSTQGRVSASRAATFNIANNSILPVELTTEQYDVGNYHDTVTNPDRFTVPSAPFAGNYSIKAYVLFDESTSGGTPNTGDRGVQITLNGTAVCEQRQPAAAAGDSSGCVAIDLNLVGSDIVRVTGFQDSGGTMDVGGRLTMRLED